MVLPVQGALNESSSIALKRMVYTTTQSYYIMNKRRRTWGKTLFDRIKIKKKLLHKLVIVIFTT